MRKKKNQTEDWNPDPQLRDAAEEKLSQFFSAPYEMQEKNPEELLRELQVHQIELEIQNEELKKTQVALEESREQYADLYHFAPVGYFTFTPEALIKEVNLTGSTLLGVARQKLINTRFRKIVTANDQDLWDQHFLSVLREGEKQSCDLILRRPEGSTFYAGLESIRREAGRGAFLVHTTVTDITERKRLEEVIEQSEERYRTAIIEEINEGYYEVDLDGNFIFVNDSMTRLLQYSRQELIGMNYRTYVPQEEVEGVYKTFNRVYRTGEIIKDYPVTNIRKDGTPLLIEESISCRRDREGRVIGFRGISRDVSKRRRAEDELKKNIQLLSDTGEMAEVGGWELDLSTKEVSWTDVVRRIHRVEPGYRAKLEEAMNFFAPESRPALGEAFKKAAETGESWDLESLFIPSGSKDRIWVRSLGKAVYSGDKIIKITGTFQNIDKYKRAEAQLRTSLREKDLLLREVHHRVKNNLQVVQSLLNLQARKIKDPLALAVFNQSRDRIRSMSLVHEKLYQSPDFTRIDMTDYLRSLSISLFHSSRISLDRVKLKVEVEKVHIGIDKAVPLGLIINELISNGLKHAFPGGRTGEIRVGLSMVDEEMIRLTVGDNGIGFPRDVDFGKTESMGFQVVMALVQQLEGTIGFHQEVGTEFRITFPRKYNFEN